MFSSKVRAAVDQELTSSHPPWVQAASSQLLLGERSHVSDVGFPSMQTLLLSCTFLREFSRNSTLHQASGVDFTDRFFH